MLCTSTCFSVIASPAVGSNSKLWKKKYVWAQQKSASQRSYLRIIHTYYTLVIAVQVMQISPTFLFFSFNLERFRIKT